MPTLSSSIVKREVASVHDVEEALARQSVYGGDLITNLLELRPVNEEQLAGAVAESLGLEPLPIGRLPRATDRVRHLIPGELARRHTVYPLSATEDELLVAVSEVLPRQVISDLENTLGLRVRQRSSILVRVLQANARDYGLELDRRVTRVLARLDNTHEPPRSVAPHVEDAPSISVIPEELDALGEDAPRTSSPSGGRSSQRSVDFSFLASERAHALKHRRRLGPRTMAMAEADLRDSETRDQVIAAFFEFASQYFEYSALFAVQGDLVEGRDAHGAGADRNTVLGIGIPLDLPSTLAQVIEKEPYRLARLTLSGLDGALVKDLERRPGVAVLLLPIRVRDRTVLVLYGDHGDSDVQLESVGDVISLAPLVASALARVILRKKGRRSVDPIPRPKRPGATRRSEASRLPRLSDRAETLRAALLDTSPSNARISSPPAVQPVISVGPPRVSTPPLGSSLAPPTSYPPRSTASGDPHPASSRPLDESRPRESRQSDRRTGLRDASSPPSAMGRSATPVRMPAPPPQGLPPGFSQPAPVRLSSTSGFEPEATPARVGEPAAPEIVVQESTLDQSLEELLTESDPPPPNAALSRALSHSPRPLPVAGHSKELALPTVIVDLSESSQQLVERASRGDSDASARLVELGSAAITALVGAFPGPILQKLPRGSSEGPPRASDCGPILRTLVRIGPKAAPALELRTMDPNPEVRSWATRLFGEMPSEEAARAVARRFLDEDPDVRRAALAAGRMLQTHSGAGRALADALSELLHEQAGNGSSTHVVIQALADLREARAMPSLAALLASDSPDVQRSAHWALIVLARHDCGLEPVAWEIFWERNRSRHRVEWLIDALTDEAPDIRRAAGDELKSVTKEYFGYYDDLPANERERAQSRYRTWWEQDGRARFGTPQR